MATDQQKAASNSELLTSEQLRHTISTLVEEEIKKLQADQNKEEGTVLRQFAGEVGVTGLSDSIKAKHKIVKFLWALIFVGGLGATGYFVYKLFEEYRDEPTATKINIKNSDTYKFPRIAMCFDTWLDTEKAIAMGLSKESIRYALRYLIPFEDVATQEMKKSKKDKSVEAEFRKVFDGYNFTSLVDFFKYIALDAVLNSKNEKEIGFKCSGCPIRDQLEKTIIDKSVCYMLPLKEVDGKLRQAYGLPEFEIRVPDMSQGLLDMRAYWKLYTNPMTTHLMSDSPYTSIYEQHAHSVRLYSEAYVSAIADWQHCVPTGDDKDHPTYSAMSCVLGCASSFYQLLHGCSVLNLDRNHTRPLEEYCNTYYWDRWPIREKVDQEFAKFMMGKCIDACKSECAFTSYFISIDHHLSNSLVRDAAAWSNQSDNGIKMRSTKVYFINLDALAGGVRTFTEVSTYSFQTLVGNIGGTCGIWIGVSVMTLIHLFMFFVERSLDNGCCNGKKENSEKEKAKAKAKQKEAEVNANDHPEQAALV